MYRAFAIIILTLAHLALSQKCVTAQSQDKCSQVGYVAPESNVQPYLLLNIEGQAVYASPEAKWELGPGGGVCVVIFDQTSRSRVATTLTDDRGQFQFSKIKSGAFTLVATAGDLQVMSIPVQRTSISEFRFRRLVLHLRERVDARKSHVTLVTRSDLRRELLVMVEEDQQIRNEMIKKGAEHKDKSILSRMDVIDRKNTLRIKSIIKKHGWPGPALVGWDGSDAAFVIVQHSDHQTQKTLLLLAQKAFRSGDLSGPNYALFIDRVLVEDGKLQIYGSRAKPMDQWQGGEPVFYPITDEANVDRRRSEVGLSPMVEYRRSLKAMYKN